MNSQVIIVAGMHRSGTSFVANLLQSCGLEIGDVLLGPAKGNRYGHFEDVDFIEFHDRLLKSRGLNFLVPIPRNFDDINPDERAEANVLINKRNSRALWGWKDPRTSLFLDFWHELIPDAKYILVYRHPLEVALSFFRRGTDLDIVKSPLLCLQVWKTYNRAILDFYKSHPNICILANVGGISRSVEFFLEFVNSTIEISLPINCRQDIFDPSEMKQFDISEEVNDLLEPIDPETIALYRDMEAMANLNSSFSIAPTAGEHALFAESIRNVIRTNLEKNASIVSMFQLLLSMIDPQAVTNGFSELSNYVQSLEANFEGVARSDSGGAKKSRLMDPNRFDVQLHIYEKEYENLTRALGHIAPHHPSLHHGAPDSRVVSFPDESSLGQLQIRQWGETAWVWQDYGIAAGDVKVPPAQELYLLVDSVGSKRLAALNTLEPDDLQSIFIGHQPVMDVDLLSICQITGLFTLDLRATDITDHGLRALTVLKKLRTLVLPVQISDRAINNLQYALPNCHIFRDQ